MRVDCHESPAGWLLQIEKCASPVRDKPASDGSRASVPVQCGRAEQARSRQSPHQSALKTLAATTRPQVTVSAAMVRAKSSWLVQVTRKPASSIWCGERVGPEPAHGQNLPQPRFCAPGHSLSQPALCAGAGLSPAPLKPARSPSPAQTAAPGPGGWGRCPRPWPCRLCRRLCRPPVGPQN